MVANLDSASLLEGVDMSLLGPLKGVCLQSKKTQDSPWKMRTHYEGENADDGIWKGSV